jgi:hypothetical protein
MCSAAVGGLEPGLPPASYVPAWVHETQAQASDVRKAWAHVWARENRLLPRASGRGCPSGRPSANGAVRKSNVIRGTFPILFYCHSNWPMTCLPINFVIFLLNQLDNLTRLARNS